MLSFETDEKNPLSLQASFLAAIFFIRNLSWLCHRESYVDFFSWVLPCVVLIYVCSFGSVAELTEPVWVRQSTEEFTTELSYVQIILTVPQTEVFIA